MRGFVSIAAALAAMLVAAPALAQSDTPEWCRNGWFPREETLDVMIVKGPGKIYFHRDDGFTQGCPDKGKACRAGYVLPQQEVLVGHRMGGWVCAYYQPSATAGWMQLDALQPASEGPRPHRPLDDWAGRWISNKGEDIRIDITVEGQALNIRGDAVYPSRTYAKPYPGKQVGQFSATSDGWGKSSLSLEHEDCAVTLRRVGRFLVSTDNGECGGANVRFNAVLARKQ